MRSLPVGAVRSAEGVEAGVQALQVGGVGRIVDQVAGLFGIGVEELLRPVPPGKPKYFRWSCFTISEGPLSSW